MGRWFYSLSKSVVFLPICQVNSVSKGKDSIICHPPLDVFTRTQALEMSMPLGLLSLALEFVSTEVATSGRSIESALTGLPMVLLEDFLESQACLLSGTCFGERGGDSLS